MTDLHRFLIVALVLVITGCSITNKNAKAISRAMLPVNLVVGYFGAVASHEAGHAFTAEAVGGENTRISVVPSKDDDGNQHLGYTTTRFEDPPSDLESTLFHVMGPTAQWAGHMGTRILLRSGYVPRLAQPTLAWFGVLNQIGFYAHTIYGLARIEHTDLGKEQAWISAVMLLGGLTIDLIDIFTDEPSKYFGVLLGESFYENEDPKKPDVDLGLMVVPQKGGGFLGLRAVW